MDEHGTPAVKLGPPPSATPEERDKQQRNMGWNEGWLAAIAHIEKYVQDTKPDILVFTNSMKDYRR